MAGAPDKEEVVDEEQQSFEGLGLDPRLVRALSKISVAHPTPIQRVGIPLILGGKDVVARANTGSGKTLTYLLPMLQKLFPGPDFPAKGASGGVRAFVLVPSRELCKQVHDVAMSLLDHCRVQLKVVQLLSDMPLSDLKMVLAGHPEVIVSTPSCVSTCLARGTLQPKTLRDMLSVLVLDEADLLLSFGYEDDIKALVHHVPRSCQCLLMTATPSDGSGGADIEKLKKLVLHNPVILTLSEDRETKKDIIPESIEQFWISCSLRDKLLYILALLKLEIIRKKVLIFVNSIDMGFRLRLFLEQFGLRSVVLNAELPQNSRLHILEEFNAGLFDYLVATDMSNTNEKEEMAKDQSQSKKKKHSRPRLDSEFGVVRGIDFKNVYTVINFDMPHNSAGYVHRIGRTGRAHNTGAAISLVSPEEADVFDEIKLLLGEVENKSTNLISPFPLLTDEAVESLRYRVEDVAKSVTKVAIRESRAQDLRNEILNSEKLKAHFDDNPRDLDLLKHDKVLSKKPPPSHLQEVPEYLVDPKTKEASRIVKLSQAAMNINSSKRKAGFKRGFGKSRDPLRTFSALRKKSPKQTNLEMKNDNVNHRGSYGSKRRKAQHG